MAYKEIVTKAVIGKGKKYYNNKYELEAENKISNILGCWVINHNFKGYEENEKIIIEGAFDINLWYSYEGDTKTTVITKKIDYKEIVLVKQKESTDSNSKDIIVRSLKQPNCKNATATNNIIKLEIEKELGIEIVGDTKVKIAIEEDEEPWDIIVDDKEEEQAIEQIDNIKEDYIDESK